MTISPTGRLSQQHPNMQWIKWGPPSPEFLAIKEAFMTLTDEQLNAQYRREGWGVIAEKALNIPPVNVESSAREVARYAYEQIIKQQIEINNLQQQLANANFDIKCLNERMTKIREAVQTTETPSQEAVDHAVNFHAHRSGHD